MIAHIVLARHTADRAEAYRQFRGRAPDANALLRTRRFPTGEPAAGPEANTGGSHR